MEEKTVIVLSTIPFVRDYKQINFSYLSIQTAFNFTVSFVFNSESKNAVNTIRTKNIYIQHIVLIAITMHYIYIN